MALSVGGLGGMLGGLQQVMQGQAVSAKIEMTPLQSLLYPVWQEEETKKAIVMSDFRARFERFLTVRSRKLTPKQKKIRDWVGDIGEITRRSQEAQEREHQSYIMQQNVLAAAAQQYIGAQAPKFNPLSQSFSQTGQGAALTSTVHPSLPHSYQLERFLRAVEKEKGRRHRYDDDASNITDTRLCNSEIPLLWVLSYCLSNNTAPELGVMVLEHHGFTLVVEHDDP